LRKQLTDTTKSIYSNLDPWETVLVARHKERPQLTDYLALVFDEFVELHGDKFYGDDRALRTGFAKLDEFKVARRPKNGPNAFLAVLIPKAIARRCPR